MLKLPGLILIVTLCACCFARLKASEKIPVDADLAYLNTQEKKIILVVNSSKEKSFLFFKELAKHLPEKGVMFYLVDTGEKLDPTVEEIYAALNIPKNLVQDVDRKTNKGLGVIIRPIVFFVNDDQVINSVVVNYRSNLGAILKSHISAFLKGEPPKDFFESYKSKKKKNMVNSLFKRGEKLFYQDNYERALQSWNEALEQDGSHLESMMGKGYALLFLSRYEESRKVFQSLRETKDKKRFQFAYELTFALESSKPESLEVVSHTYKYEHHYFPALVQAAETLDKAGKCDESKKIYKQSYKVLLKHYKGLK